MLGRFSRNQTALLVVFFDCRSHISFGPAKFYGDFFKCIFGRIKGQI